MGNTPNVRFKGFTEDWEQRKLGDLVISHNAGIYISKEDYGTGTNVIGVGNIYDNDIFDGEIYRLGPVNDEKFLLEENDLIYGESSLVPEGIARTVCVGKNGVGSAFAWHTRRVKLDQSVINSHFATLELNYNIDVRKYLISVSTQTALTGMTTEGYFGVTLSLPTVEEQAHISSLFKQLDHLITLHQQKCDETKELKKYMLQNMFPQKDEKVPKIRFDGFTGDWEQRKLGDFGKATGGTSIESEFSEDGIYKVISIGSYSENSVYNDQGIRAIKSDKTSNRVLNRNDLTMILNDKTTSGNIIGRVLLIEESGIYVYNQRTERIEINLDEYDPVFLYEMLNAPNIREKIIKQAQGNTQIYVNWTAISLLEYMIPSKEEQVKIGEYLHSISNLITLHQQKCAALKEFKKYMLQNMFPQKGENKCQN